MKDDLKIFKQSVSGGVYHINDNIRIRNPSLGEICEFGEREYYSMVSMLCSNSSSYKVTLWDMGIDWETVEDWQFFISIHQHFTKEQTSILFGDLDISKLTIVHDNKINDTVLAATSESGESHVIIDKALYLLITDYVRKLHGFEIKIDKAKNKYTKRYMIERERVKNERQKNAVQESMLRQIISSMVVQPGFDYNYATVWDLSISAFNESINRTQKYLTYKQTMQGIYSGCINSKEIDFSEVNWLN